MNNSFIGLLFLLFIFPTLFLFLRVFFRTVSSSQQNWGGSTKISHTSLLLNCIAYHVVNIPQKCNKRVVHLLILMNLYWHIIITQSVQYILRFTFIFVHCMYPDKYVMMYIYHYNIIQSIFTTLKIFYPPPIHPSYPWQPLISFTVSIVLPPPECHIVEIIQCRAFSDWFLPLSNIYFIFLCVFSWLDSLFVCSTE